MRALFAGFSAGLLVLAAGEAWRFTAHPVGVGSGTCWLPEMLLYFCTAFLWLQRRQCQ